MNSELALFEAEFLRAYDMLSARFGPANAAAAAAAVACGGEYASNYYAF